MRFRPRARRAEIERVIEQMSPSFERLEIVRLRRAMRQARIQIGAGSPVVASETLRQALDGDRL